VIPPVLLPTVVVVDDSPGEAHLMVEANLETGCRFDCRIELDARDALRDLQRSPSSEWPDLLLLDLNMGVFGGLQFLAKRRDDPRLPLLPVFVLTNSTNPDHVVQAHALGADAYLVKPGEWERSLELAEQVGSYLLSGEPVPGHGKVFVRLERQRQAWDRWISHRRLVDGSRERIERSLDLLRRSSAGG
jgi:CheY-like chemotaxis protein